MYTCKGNGGTTLSCYREWEIPMRFIEKYWPLSICAALVATLLHVFSADTFYAFQQSLPALVEDAQWLLGRLIAGILAISFSVSVVAMSLLAWHLCRAKPGHTGSMRMREAVFLAVWSASLWAVISNGSGRPDPSEINLLWLSAAIFIPPTATWILFRTFGLHASWAIPGEQTNERPDRGDFSEFNLRH